MAEVEQSFVEHDGNHEGDQMPENQVPEDQLPQDQVPENEVPEYQVAEYQIPEYQLPEDQEQEDQVPQDQVIEGQVPEDQVPQDQVPENSQSEQKQEQKDSDAGGGEKKWPGWPGESVFRMLVPAQKVGSIIGRKGEFIKKIVEETRARIKILDGPPGTAERAVRSANFKGTNHKKIPILKDQRSRLQGSAFILTKC